MFCLIAYKVSRKPMYAIHSITFTNFLKSLDHQPIIPNFQGVPLHCPLAAGLAMFGPVFHFPKDVKVTIPVKPFNIKLALAVEALRCMVAGYCRDR